MTNNLFIGKPLAFNVMLKPIGSVCNLNCTYCYYLEKKNLYPDKKKFTIPENVLELFIKQYIEIQEIPLINFVWQGGEPTMLGIDFFKKAFDIQKKYAGKKQIDNIIQTNGTLLTDEWCKFFNDNNILVGISVDGPEFLHNKYRKRTDNQDTFKKVMQGIDLLKKDKVEFNTLTTVNDFNVNYPLEVYHFLKDIGSQFMQFLPVVEREITIENSAKLKLIQPEYEQEAELTSWSVGSKEYGDFLIGIFNEWVRNDVSKYYVQLFDATLANWVGANPGLCVYKEICGDALAMEHNGDIYSCDHFVYPEEFIGNILEDSLIEMVKSEKQLKFGERKLKSLPKQCLKCDYRFTCHGECPKHRISYSKDGEYGLNHLCEGLYNFFSHVHPYMQFMTDELKNKRPPANVMQWARKIKA
ncbi:anaerobic sulfatase-maturation protein [Bacteroidota bacterium]